LGRISTPGVFCAQGSGTLNIRRCLAKVVAATTATTLSEPQQQLSVHLQFPRFVHEIEFKGRHSLFVPF